MSVILFYNYLIAIMIFGYSSFNYKVSGYTNKILNNLRIESLEVFSFGKRFKLSDVQGSQIYHVGMRNIDHYKCSSWIGI